MDDQDNVKLIRQCYDSFLQGDIERLLSVMTQDIDWQLPQMEGVPYGGRRHGIDQVREFFQLLGAAQKPLEFHPGEFVAHGDRVVVTGHHDWTVNKNGADFGTDWVEIFTVRDGRLVSFTELLDTFAVANAYRDQASPADLGAMPSVQCPSIH